MKTNSKKCETSYWCYIVTVDAKNIFWADLDKVKKVRCLEMGSFPLALEPISTTFSVVMSSTFSKEIKVGTECV